MKKYVINEEKTWLLNIKTIDCLIDGKVEMIGKARGSKKAFDFINNYVKDKVGIAFFEK
ncbi:MAG: hypothetical protein IKJ30_00520 [Bacilli bacterium]|nr:hypothetical protein [Bacilli bacterium]